MVSGRDAHRLGVGGVDDETALLCGRDDGTGHRSGERDGHEQTTSAHALDQWGVDPEDDLAQLRAATGRVLHQAGALDLGEHGVGDSGRQGLPRTSSRATPG